MSLSFNVTPYNRHKSNIISLAFIVSLHLSVKRSSPCVFLFFRLFSSVVATEDFTSQVVPNVCILPRLFNLSHVLFHHIHEPPVWPSPFPLSWQLHPQHPSPNIPIISPRRRRKAKKQGEDARRRRKAKTQGEDARRRRKAKTQGEDARRRRKAKTLGEDQVEDQGEAQGENARRRRKAKTQCEDARRRRKAKTQGEDADAFAKQRGTTADQ